MPVFHLHEKTVEALRNELNQADIIIDAILGTGVNGPVREPFNQVISLVNEYAGKKSWSFLSISHQASAAILESGRSRHQSRKDNYLCVSEKRLFLEDGPKYIGEWKAVDISVPASIVA